MRIINFSRDHTRPVVVFDATEAANVHIGSGRGESHIYGLYIDAGGSIGQHPAGFAQFFLVVAGSGWAAGPDGVRVSLTAGQGAYFAPGELHSKGSDTGMTVVMVQADELEPSPD